MMLAAASSLSFSLAESASNWEATGWGGGGFYFSAAFHPKKDGVIYLGGDVGGLYKTDDHGVNWRMINKGLAGYGVFSLATDPGHPDTLYAATDSGLCKSIDAGENWRLLPKTGPKELRITGEKNKSIRSVAVDPSDGNRIFAGSPTGKLYKSTDGGETWTVAWANTPAVPDPGTLRAQFGQVNGAIFGGLWLPLTVPDGGKGVVGIGLRVRTGGTAPRDAYLSVRTKGGAIYTSVNLRKIFSNLEAQDLVLRSDDFSIDPLFAKEQPEKASKAPPKPDLSRTVRMDFSLVGPPSSGSSILWLQKVFFVRTDGGKDVFVTAREFSPKDAVQVYGNLRVGQPGSGPVFSVAISAKEPALVAAATNTSGIILSRDHGTTWTALDTPKRASGVVFDPANPKVLYATFFTEGLWKTTDQGATWTRLNGTLPAGLSLREVAMSPGNSQDVYVIGQKDWGGQFWISRDAGATWKSSNGVKADYAANPTVPSSGATVPLSIPTNIAINPQNPKELYVSANWRSCLSKDGGETFEESMKGADISCISDIRFSGDRVYVTAMDEGTLASNDQGATWLQLWPLKHDPKLSGHNWRIGVRPVNGQDWIIATGSPWDAADSNIVVVSEDGGKTFKRTTEGLPKKELTANTMWGRGYPRAFAADPTNSKIAYLGIDGDPSGNNPGGGIFKTEDGGYTWKQLENQPGSRRMYFGLAIDPTNPKRLYWAGFGQGGGVYRSEDGGASWQHVFKDDAYLFNIMTTADGTVYTSGRELHVSKDHGQTWKRLTNFNNDQALVGIEVHPSDPKTIWISYTVWNQDAKGGIFKTTDGGQTWNEITGDIPYVRPQILRFNPKTNELWAGYVGLYKLKQ